MVLLYDDENVIVLGDRPLVRIYFLVSIWFLVCRGGVTGNWLRVFLPG